MFLLLLASCSDVGLKRVTDEAPLGERVLEVSPSLLDFGAVAENAPVSSVVTLTSTGELPVTVHGFTSPSAPFALTVPEDELTLDPGESTELVVTWTPATAADAGTLGVHSDAVVPDVAVALRGAGHYPALSVIPAALTLVSSYGESVDGVVTAWNVGTADLVIASTSLRGEAFTVSGDAFGEVDLTLVPGASTDLAVTYTPIEGEDVSTGELWFSTNAQPESAMVPLTGQLGPVCIGLGEAWDRGLLRARTTAFSSNFQLKNEGEDDICVDHWYIWRSTGSQDLGAGDMAGDFGGEYPAGTLGVAAGGHLSFDGASVRGESWWCVEQTQYTQAWQDYTFTGARVPEPLLTYMLAADQDAVWGWMEDHPVMIGGRVTNYAEIGRGGGTVVVTLEVVNMGGQAGAAELREPLPAGWAVSDAGGARQEPTTDGGTMLVFEASLAARTLTDAYVDTIYDRQTFQYTVAVPPCSGKQVLAPMETGWTDMDGVARVGTANPLVVNCL